MDQSSALYKIISDFTYTLLCVEKKATQGQNWGQIYKFAKVLRSFEGVCPPSHRLLLHIDVNVVERDAASRLVQPVQLLGLATRLRQQRYQPSCLHML